MSEAAKRGNDYAKSMGHLISMLYKSHKRFMTSHLRQYGISGPMYRFIYTLSRHPGAMQDFLSEFFYMDKGNVARVTKRLEELGFITRQVDPEDRRQYKLFLTAKGEDLVPKIRSLLNEWSRLLTENFEESEAALASSLLERMLDNAQDHL